MRGKEYRNEKKISARFQMTNSVFFPIPCGGIAITSHDGFMFLKIYERSGFAWYPERMIVTFSLAIFKLSSLIMWIRAN